MSKLVLNTVTSGYSGIAAINNNNDLIETEFDNTLSLDGSSPNSMLADLDMNGHRILNELAQSGDGFIWEGTWTTGLVYNLNNLVSDSGNTYICLVGHRAGAMFAVDLAAGKWVLLAQRGLPGTGGGDVYVASNLSEFAATKTIARSNLNAATSGVNNDITKLTGCLEITGMTTPLTVAQGGTGLTSLASLGVPVGTLIDFAGAVGQTPSGYVVCNGASVATTGTYANLFAAIGYLWGGSGGYFNIPNFPAFYAAVQNNGTVGASTTGEIKAHVHAISYVANLNGSGFAQGAGSANNATFGTATQSTGGTANLAAGMCVLKCIKY